MGDYYIQLNAQKIILEFKLNKIRDHIRNRLSMIEDVVVKNELQCVLNMIEKFEIVPSDWNLTEPIVKDVKED